MKKFPKRTCIGCNEVKLKKELIRVVKNKEGEGILLSYYPQSETKLFDSASEMRIRVLSKNHTQDCLNGLDVYVVATDGGKEKENYTNNIKFSIDNREGIKILASAANVAHLKPNYHVVFHNCDTVATTLLSRGGIDVESKILPKETYRNQLE